MSRPLDQSYPFSVYSGLLTPVHYEKIGNAIWLFLWCISSTTKEIERDGMTWGIVLGNKPLKAAELALQFGVNEKTVRRWLALLERNGYIAVTRAPYGMICQSDIQRNLPMPAMSGQAVLFGQKRLAVRTSLSNPIKISHKSTQNII